MMRSRSPGELAASSARKKYTYAAFFLVLSLVAFCVQTELSAHIQGDLGWDKAYCMMFFTHGSWVLMWPVQLLILRLQKRDMPWDAFWRRHLQLVKSTALMVELQTLDVFGLQRPAAKSVRYVARTTAFITTALTVAGLSWYVAVSLTTPSDLTAIYNCSAFFAYAFSVPLLKEPLRLDKSVAVIIAIIGVLVVAYGDTGGQSAEGQGVTEGGEGVDVEAGNRFLGNIVIGVGSVLYGLYEVLYKRFACPPDGCSPGRGMIFANTFGSCIGLFTLSVLWIPLPLLHWTGLEIFELPKRLDVLAHPMCCARQCHFQRLVSHPHISYVSRAVVCSCTSYNIHRCSCGLVHHRPAIEPRSHNWWLYDYCCLWRTELEHVPRDDGARDCQAQGGFDGQ